MQTRYEAVKVRVTEFAERFGIANDAFAISGNAAWLALSDKGYRNWPAAEGKPEVIRLLLDPGFSLASTPMPVVEHGIWCGANYTEAGLTAGTGMGVFSEDRITVLVDPFWPDMTPILYEGLQYVPAERLLHVPGLDKAVKFYVRKHLFRTKALGRVPTEEENAFISALANFDAHYHYSDDINVWRSGKAAEERLVNMEASFTEEVATALKQVAAREKAA